MGLVARFGTLLTKLKVYSHATTFFFLVALQKLVSSKLKRTERPPKFHSQQVLDLPSEAPPLRRPPAARYLIVQRCSTSFNVLDRLLILLIIGVAFSTGTVHVQNCSAVAVLYLFVDRATIPLLLCRSLQNGFLSVTLVPPFRPLCLAVSRHLPVPQRHSNAMAWQDASIDGSFHGSKT